MEKKWLHINIVFMEQIQRLTLLLTTLATWQLFQVSQ